MNFSKLVKPALALAFIASFSLGASADPLRKSTRQLNLNSNQRAQVQQILRSGNRQDPAVRQRMQQQILSILSPQQQQQLAWQLQQNVYQNPNYNAGNQGYQAPYGNPVYQNQECSTGNNQGYRNQFPYGNPGYQNSPYVNQQPYPYQGQGNYPYYPAQNQNQGADIGLTVLGGLLNSGILNGVFQQMMR